MTSKLGPYWSVEHRRQQDYDYFKALQPAAHLIMDGGPPDYAFVHENEPNTIILARDWALSEQHSDMLKDPAGTGLRHAREWHEHQPKLGFDRAKTLILGINEPHVWEPGVSEALRQYTIALCSEAKKLGLRVGAMQLGVGWPGNNGPDTPPDWSPFHGVEQAIIDNGGALVTHEYWADQGPSENWGWWAGRTLKCPWQAPIIIGECGVDMFVKDTSGGQQNRGWVGHMPPAQYADNLWRYTYLMSQDPRFVGNAVFASDYQSRVDWFSFDVEPAYQAILAAKIPDTPPLTIHLPEIKVPAPEPAQPTTPSPDLPVLAPIEPRVAQAILAIESGGQTFGPDGRPLIRFEAHIFRQFYKHDNLWSQYFAVDDAQPWVNQLWRPSPSGPWQQIHVNQASEYAAFDFARSLNPDAAYNSISVGSAQIMGFNHARIGYSTAEAMYNAFADGNMQVIGFINYLLSDPDLAAAMRNKDWRTIAAKYNGTGAVESYSKQLQQAYNNLASG